jgi:diguanylate cyclase (GGDEF)-like protein
MAREVKREVRESHAAGRFGGEEFVLILPDCDKASATGLAEKIRAAFGQLDLKSGTQ